MTDPLLRPATSEDLPALAALQNRFEEHFFGAAESSDDETGEMLGMAADLGRDARVVVGQDADLDALALVGSHEGVLTIDPTTGPARRAAAATAAAAWLEGTAVDHIEVLSVDLPVLEALHGRGWTHELSAFDLVRDASPLPAPDWPAGITVSGIDRAADAAAVHDLIYRRSAWSQVPGHPDRPLASWYRLFLDYEGYDPDQQVLARRDGVPVGVATGRIFSDGIGYVQQLAVARAERRQGLGRSLLLAGLGRRLAAGATRLGLSVSAANAGALTLYRSVGLRIDREWRHLAPPRR